ncbi:MAG: molybdopterin molybdotransferase MoeA [Gammaproteobacteria bacterium]|nr:molybdopterin molybdotransferase MoeA [Gammaproteobacteria bacterium]
MIDPCSLEPKRLLTLDEALAVINNSVRAITSTEQIGLTNALGRVLAEDVLSPINLPFDRNSAMDGYAFSSANINTDQSFTLQLTGASWAGKPYSGKLEAGQCIRIFTGAVVPEAADSVVIQEQVSTIGELITFPAHVVIKQNIREAGEEFKAGDRLCAEHKGLSPADVGLLAAAGIQRVCVYRPLKVAFFTTGDELLTVGQTPEIGKIYDSNRYLLAGFLTDPRYQLTDLGILPDDKAILTEQLQQAANRHDVIITTGGASVGEADFINEVLVSCGQINFWKIAIKPGKPLAFGKIDDCYVFGLPGNPVSAAVTFQQVVIPALHRLSGAGAYQPLRFLATADCAFKKAPGRQEFVRGILSQDAKGQFLAVTTGAQGSHILSSLSKANCYIILSADSKGINPGEQVLVEPFSVLL